MQAIVGRAAARSSTQAGRAGPSSPSPRAPHGSSHEGEEEVGRGLADGRRPGFAAQASEKQAEVAFVKGLFGSLHQG